MKSLNRQGEKLHIKKDGKTKRGRRINKRFNATAPFDLITVIV